MRPMARVATKDYGRQYRALWHELAPVIERTMCDDDPVLGAALERFEANLARYHQVRHAVGVGSGTDAIIHMVRALGIDGEIVTCAHTFAGVVSALIQAGVEPRLVDGEVLEVAAVERAITPRTRAVLAVHLHGLPVALDELAALCHAHGLILLEDAAQAHGASYAGRPVGSFGAAAALSFHPSKNLGAFGDGGAILTSSDDLAARLRVIRNLGKDDKYRFAEIAPNTKLDTLQAAVLDVKLGHLDGWIARRRDLAARYRRGLRGVGDLQLPDDRGAAMHAYHLYVVHTAQRDDLRDFLASHGVATGLHYPIAAARQPALARHFAGQSFPIADMLASSCLSLPLSHEHEDAEVDQVIERVRAFFAPVASLGHA